MVSELPLISCIMPTRVRRTAFVAQAIRLFQAQDYPRKELIIIDGDSEDLHKISAYGVIPSEAEIAYVYVDLAGTLSQLTIGAKRNLAVSLAHGEIIAHWDDDDYYAPDRLSRQVAPLLAGEADISGLAMDGVLDLNEMAAWRCGPTLHNEIFALGVHGGTLLYRKSLWGQTAAFQNSSSGEDGAFLRLVLSQGRGWHASPIMAVLFTCDTRAAGRCRQIRIRPCASGGRWRHKSCFPRMRWPAMCGCSRRCRQLPR